MSSLTIQNRHPPNDAADFVANRVELLGVTEVQYDAEQDQMRVDARLPNHEAPVESDPLRTIVQYNYADLCKDQICGPTSQTSVTSSLQSWKISSRNRKLNLVWRRSMFASVLGHRS